MQNRASSPADLGVRNVVTVLQTKLVLASSLLVTTMERAPDCWSALATQSRVGSASVKILAQAVNTFGGVFKGTP